MLRRRSLLAAQALARPWRTWWSTPNPAPIFLLGNQRSGTSAITRLLAEMTGRSATIDLRPEFHAPCYPAVHRGELPFSHLLERNRLEFSRDLIKAPDLTFFFDELRAEFPAARFVFIVRDPRANIRSVLDRLGLPGDTASWTPEQWATIPPGWRLVVDGRWLGLRGASPVEMLAARWNRCADVFLKHRQHFRLVRYEDFLDDKAGELDRLAAHLGLPKLRDVSSRLDDTLQRRGANRRVPWRAFFGDNLACIESRCSERMHALGYRKARAA